MLFSTLFVLVAIQAAEPAKPQCEGATQQEMNACAAYKAGRADEIMQAKFDELMSLMEQEDRALRADGYLGLSRPLMLKASQQQWLGYRDQQCSFESFEFAHGSMQPMVGDECFARMARHRTMELQAALSGYRS